MIDVSLLFYIVVLVCCRPANANDWSVNVHCRDNGYSPLDWWIMYKPPSIRRGRNFTFLTPHSEGRWEASDLLVTSHSMLMNTIAPLFTDQLVQKNLAVLIYSERHGIKESAVQGILLADETGGIWISHSIPGFPDVDHGNPTFPAKELEKGHIITCMSLDHAVLDGIIKVISQTEPDIRKIHVPAHLTEALPSWIASQVEGNTKVVDFVTRDKKINPILVARKPGDNHCLFEMFARAKKVILDVYGDSNMDKSFCYEGYGVRKIQSVSLKFKDEVYYINNSTDRATFGVSTAAHWQKRGAGPTQYWTCISNYEKPGVSQRGNMIFCVKNYDLWLAFSNLKVKEPNC